MGDRTFYATLGVAIPIAVRLVGGVFVFGFLVLPALTAMMLARTLRSVVIVALVLAAGAPVLGFWAAFLFDLPAGPSIVATLFLFFLVAWIRHVARGS